MSRPLSLHTTETLADARPEYVVTTVVDHWADPPVGTRLRVLAREHDEVIVGWDPNAQTRSDTRRWPMLLEHVRQPDDTQAVAASPGRAAYEHLDGRDGGGVTPHSGEGGLAFTAPAPIDPELLDNLRCIAEQPSRGVESSCMSALLSAHDYWRNRVRVTTEDIEREGLTAEHLRRWLTPRGWSRIESEGGRRWQDDGSCLLLEMWRPDPSDGRGVYVPDRDDSYALEQAIKTIAFHFDMPEQAALVDISATTAGSAVKRFGHRPAPRFHTDPPTFDPAGNQRFKRLKLDPDLADGQHWTIHDVPDRVLLDNIRAWMDEAAPGDGITIEIVEMSDAEAEALPGV